LIKYSFHFYGFFSQVISRYHPRTISRYHPNHSVTVCKGIWFWGVQIFVDSMVTCHPRKYRFRIPTKIFLLMAPATKFCLYQFHNTCWKWRTMSKEQAAKIFLGMWPIISLSLTTEMAKGSNAFPTSHKQGNTCP